MLLAVNYDLWTMIGALLSGIGSFMVGIYAIRSARKESSDEHPAKRFTDDGGTGSG